MENTPNKPQEDSRTLFPALDLADCLRMPQELAWSAAEFWSKSSREDDRLRAIGILENLPRINGRMLNKKALCIALRTCADETCREWLAAASADLAAAGANPATKLGNEDLGKEGALAAWLGKKSTCEYLGEHAQGLKGELSLTGKDGTQTMIDFASQCLKKGFHDAFSLAWTKKAASSHYGSNSLSWAIHSGCSRGKALLDNKDLGASEKSWDIYKAIFDGATSAKVAKRAFSDLAEDHAHLYGLAYSKSARVREEFRAISGAQEAIDKFLKSCQEGRNSKSWHWIRPICETRDEKLIAHAMQRANMKTWVVESENFYSPLAFDLIRWGGAPAARVLCQELEKSGSEVMDTALAQAQWVWEGKNGGRKKGDALALCVALGDLDSARELLASKPGLNCAYAKALVKYSRDKGNEIQGLATSAWESILLGKIAEESAAKSPMEEPPVRRQSRL